LNLHLFYHCFFHDSQLFFSIKYLPSHNGIGHNSGHGLKFGLVPTLQTLQQFIPLF
jgi:hypothetical protein